MTRIRLQQNRMNPLVLPLILAQEEGFFKERQVDVHLELSDSFVFSGNKPFLTNDVDAIMGDTTFFFYYLNEGKKAVITSTLTRTIQLVGYQDWQSLPLLTVGINRTGLFRFFLDTYLSDYLPPTTYSYINNTYQRIEALNQHDIQALVAIEPFVSQIHEELDTTLIWHSNEIEACYVMWCFDENFAHQHPEVIRHFHLALEDAARFFNEQSPSEKISLIETHCGLQPTHAKSFEHFTFEPQANYSPKDFMLCQKWLHDNGEISDLIDSETGIFKTFI